MAMTDLTRRKLAYMLGSHHLAANVETRWEAGGSGTLADDEVCLQRAAHKMGYCAAKELFTASTGNFDADSTMDGFTRERFSYALGPGGKGAVTELAATMTA